MRRGRLQGQWEGGAARMGPAHLPARHPQTSSAKRAASAPAHPSIPRRPAGSGPAACSGPQRKWGAPARQAALPKPRRHPRATGPAPVAAHARCAPAPPLAAGHARRLARAPPPHCPHAPRPRSPRPRSSSASRCARWCWSGSPSPTACYDGCPSSSATSCRRGAPVGTRVCRLLAAGRCWLLAAGCWLPSSAALPGLHACAACCTPAPAAGPAAPAAVCGAADAAAPGERV